MIRNPGRLVRTKAPRRLRSRAGLSLVELVVAMLILTVGLLGMAAGTGWMIRTVDLAQLETARSAALQSAMEELRGTPWTELQNGQATHGDFQVGWRLVGASSNGEGLDYEFEVTGPGRIGGMAQGLPVISPNATTTFTYRISRP